MSPRSPRCIALLSIFGFGLLMCLVLAFASSSVGDMRAAKIVELATIVVACIILAILARDSRWARPTLAVFVMLAILGGVELTGSWNYWTARSRVHTGEYGPALECLATYQADSTRLSTLLPLGPRVPVMLCSTGIVTTSPAELWFGIARTRDYRHEYAQAVQAYDMALRSPAPLWPAQKHADVARMRDEAASKVR